MDDSSIRWSDGIGNAIRKKRSQTSRRPGPESQLLPENRDLSPLSSSPPADDVSKFSSDDNVGYDANCSRKVFNLNLCGSRDFLATGVKAECSHKKTNNDVLYGNGGSGEGTKQEQSQLFSDNSVASARHSGVIRDGVGNDSKLKKVKLKVGGVTRTIQTKSSCMSGSGFTKSSRTSDVQRPRQKLILQDNSDEDHSPPPLDKKSGLRGIPWKEFSRGGLSLGKEDSSSEKMPEKNASGKQGEKLERVRKSKRVPKKRVLDGPFSEDDEDDEIRYLEKLKNSKFTAGYENLEDFRSSRPGKDGKKSRSERVSEATDYEEEKLGSDCEPEGKKQRKDPPDSPKESKREMTLTTRQRALLSGKDASSTPGAGGSVVEFPNGLPPLAPRKQKNKLSEVELQLKKVEAAQRRRMQSEKAARESEAEAIRKILGQESSRKKREVKIKKRQEELAQEKAANAEMLASTTIRWVMGPTGTLVTFPKEMGFPHIFDPKPCSYPPPREKCAVPSCTNPYKYRDSKSKLPLCSLQCYKAVHAKMQAETAC